jgi:hypothetical protein
METMTGSISLLVRATQKPTMHLKWPMHFFNVNKNVATDIGRICTIALKNSVWQTDRKQTCLFLIINKSKMSTAQRTNFKYRSRSHKINTKQ